MSEVVRNRIERLMTCTSRARRSCTRAACSGTHSGTCRPGVLSQPLSPHASGVGNRDFATEKKVHGQFLFQLHLPCSYTLSAQRHTLGHLPFAVSLCQVPRESSGRLITFLPPNNAP